MQYPNLKRACVSARSCVPGIPAKLQRGVMVTESLSKIGRYLVGAGVVVPNENGDHSTYTFRVGVGKMFTPTQNVHRPF